MEGNSSGAQGHIDHRAPQRRTSAVPNNGDERSMLELIITIQTLGRFGEANSSAGGQLDMCLFLSMQHFLQGLGFRQGGQQRSPLVLQRYVFFCSLTCGPLQAFSVTDEEQETRVCRDTRDFPKLSIKMSRSGTTFLHYRPLMFTLLHTSQQKWRRILISNQLSISS